MQKIVKILTLCAFSFWCGNAFAQDSEPSQTAETVDQNAAAEVTQPQENANPADNAAPAEAAATENAAPADNVASAEAAAADNAAPAEAGTTAENAAPAEASTAASGTESNEVLTDALIDRRLHEISTNLDTLKEDTFTTKSRLLLLREEVLQRSVSGSRIQIRHKNDMGGQYELVQIYYAIDREPVLTKQDTSGDLNKLDDEIVFDRMLAPGAHQLNVLYVYKGKMWGVFRYMKDYTFRVESGYDFMLEEGKSAELVVTAAEQGGVFTPYEERPSVKFDYTQYDLVPDTSDEASSNASAAAGK